MPGIDYVAEWAAYAGEAEEAVRARIRSASRLVREEWIGYFGERAPSEQEMRRFYETSLTNVYDMLGRAIMAQEEHWPQECGRRLKEHECASALDYGCGLGAMGFGLAEQGLEVTLAEVAHCRHYSFLVRLAKRRQGTSVRSVDGVLDEGPWDAIVCLEVLEHCVAPDKTTERLLARLKPGGILFGSWSFPEGESDNPLHLGCNSRWAGGGFEGFLRERCGLEWLNPGPCWAQVWRKP